MLVRYKIHTLKTNYVTTIEWIRLFLLSSLFFPSGKFIPLQSYIHFLFVMKKKPEPLMNRLKQKFIVTHLFYKNLTRLTALLGNSKIRLQGFWRRSWLCHFLICKDSKLSPFLKAHWRCYHTNILSKKPMKNLVSVNVYIHFMNNSSESTLWVYNSLCKLCAFPHLDT